MRYEKIARAFYGAAWAILPEKHDEIEAIIEFHMNGGKFTAEEIRARIGDPQKPEPGKRGAVAVLPLQGLIAHRMGGMTEMSGGMSTERFAGMFRQALADDSVSAILIDVNSPGGTVDGVTELAAEIFASRGPKRIVAHVNSLAASAAYWAIAGADEIVVTPSGSVGSIGVFTKHRDTSKADEQEGVTETVISAGKYKTEALGPLSTEAKAALQARVDQAYDAFVKDVARGRGVKVADVRNGYGEGRVVTAKDALAAGMIDRIATMEDVIGGLVGRRSSSAMRAELRQQAVRADGTMDPAIVRQMEDLAPDTEELAAMASGTVIGHDDDEMRQRLERF